MKLVLLYDDEDEAKTEGAFAAQAVANLYAEAFNLFVKKNVSYGGAWQQQGYMGNVARILSKASRLKNMLWCNYPRNDTDESVEDTALDMMNIAVFFILNFRRGNKWGD